MKKLLGIIAFAAISIQSAQAQYWYPQDQYNWYPPGQYNTYPQQYNQNYYINNPRYQNERLRLSVNSPTNGASFRGNFVLAGTGTPGAQVIVNGSMNAQTVVQPNGVWRVPLSLSGRSPGSVIHLQVFARDQFGNQSDVSRVKYAVSW